MPIGYEVGFWRDVERIRNAQERLAAIETVRHLSDRREREEMSDELAGVLDERIEQLNALILTPRMAGERTTAGAR